MPQLMAGIERGIQPGFFEALFDHIVHRILGHTGMGAGQEQGVRVGRSPVSYTHLLLRDELPMDCTFVFTAQKEVGARGAFGAAFSVTPEVALVVDGADAADLAGVCLLYTSYWT